jgi:cytochrome oxidase assembly protein ShyY1
VIISGSYEPSGQLVVRNRSFGRESGFEVLVPLRRSDGSVVVIDRGWVPLGESGAAPAPVPPPPSGPVEVTARLRPGEPGSDRTPPPGQVMQIDLPRIAAGIDGPLYQAYGQLAAESPAPAQAPRLLPRPDEDLGPHLGYAWQWWLFAVAGYGLFGYHLLREGRRRVGTTGPIRWRLPAVVGRSRAGEPTDEEWEDAADR